MESDDLLEKVKARGFDSLEDFVRANLHYVSKDKQDLFYSVFGRESDRKRYACGEGYAKG